SLSRASVEIRLGIRAWSTDGAIGQRGFPSAAPRRRPSGRAKGHGRLSPLRNGLLRKIVDCGGSAGRTPGSRASQPALMQAGLGTPIIRSALLSCDAIAHRKLGGTNVPCRSYGCCRSREELAIHRHMYQKAPYTTKLPAITSAFQKFPQFPSGM